MRHILSSIIAAWPMVAKRSLSHWRLLSTVIIGVLLSSTVMAGTVIYYDALRELALKNALAGVDELDLDILVKAERGPTTVEEYEKVAAATQNEFTPRLGWLFKDVQRSAKTATFYLTKPGLEEFAGNDDARAYFSFNPELVEHITILPGGRLPSEQPLDPGDAPLRFEAIVPADAAERFGVGVGDSMSTTPYWRDRIPYASVVISGLFTRNDPDSEFWYADDTLFRSVTSGSFRTIPFYVSEQMFFNIIGANFTDMDTSYAWHLDVDRTRLNANNSTITALQVRSMRARLSTNLFGFRQITHLDEALAEYDRRLFFSKIPMFVVMVLIAVVILYYVVTLSSLLVEQQRGEIALLRSRGATSAQILAVFVLEGATISLIAVGAAPLLASAIITQLGYTPAFSELSGGEPLNVFITAGAYQMSALGGIFSFAALLIPAVRASRIGVTRHRQQSARPTGQPFFQRYYLDVMLLIVSIFLFRQLQDQGSVVATGLFGGVAVNQALLAVPALILVAFAVALLRLFPLSIRYISGDSPNLMHLIVGVSAGVLAASALFGGGIDALGALGDVWLNRAFALGVIAGLTALYWLTERAQSGRLRAAGLISQVVIVAAISISPLTLPMLDFLAYDGDAIAITPGIVGGVLVVSVSSGATGAFAPLIPLPLGLLFLAFRFYAGRAPVGFSMGMWQMARNPTHYARMSLLLILMAGLGIFAASFGGTLERSFEEQAQYATGADIRVEGVTLNNRGRSVSMVEQYEALPVVDEASPVIKTFGTDLSKLLGDSYIMVGVDGESLRRIGWFRSDFSERPMTELLTMLEHPEPPVGVAIPQDARRIGIRLKPDRPRESLALSLRIKDSNDRYFTYVMGRLGGNGEWLDLERDLARVSSFRRFSPLQPASPLTLVSLSIHDTNTRGRLRGGNIAIDEIWSRNAQAERTTLDGFDSVSDWSVLRGARESITDILQPLDAVNGQGAVPFTGGAAQFIWSEGSPLVGRGIYHGPPANPLPVLASNHFLNDTGHAVGEEFTVSVSGHRVPIRIIDTFEYFPTLDIFRRGYLISDVASVIRYTNLEPTAAEIKPNEVWLTTTSNGSDRDALVETLRGETAPFNSRNVHDRIEALHEAKVDPLVDAGWRALLFMAFGAVLILSCLGFLVHAYVSFREREMQFGLMRTVGFSMRQLVTLVWLEQAIVIAAGMALGAEMGRRLGAIIMPFLSHNDRGSQVLPPFILEIDWPTLAVTYGFMVFVFTLIILGMIMFIRRISLQRILRLGEL